MSRGEAAVIRRAKGEDVERILDLLGHYDAPRSYFEPFYLKDPSYRPEHSWVAEQDGRFVAHLRVFDRRIRVSGTELRVAGIGNVITAPNQRGRGHAGQLLRAMLDTVPAEGFAYSLLRAYQPVLYERHGWAPIDQELVRATLPPADARSVAPFGDDDLPDVMRLYDETNAGRSGTTVRSPEYWRSQLEWLREDRDGFLLSAAAALSGGRLRAFLPPSLRTLFQAHEGEITPEFGLMGRVLDLPALAAALEPVWLRRVRESGGRVGSLRLATSVGNAELRVSAEEVRILLGVSEPAHTLGERAFAHLLFRGFDEEAEERLGVGQDSSLLRTLFPAQDFVVWQSDAF